MVEISITKWIKKKIRRLIGIVEDTDTAVHSIASGKYVVWKGNLYKATSAIAVGATLSTSNLTAVSDGGLNELNNNLATKLTNTLGSPVVIGTTNYTTLADGYFVITIAASLNRHVTGFVNDAEIMSITGKDYNTGYPHTSLFVRKGMKIRVNESVSGESGANFYPFV